MEQCLNRAGLNAIILKIICVLLSLPLASALAQTAVDGALTGQLTDPNGAAISGATLQAKDLSTNLTTQTNSNPDGEFLIPRLPTGDYEVTISARWFKPLILNHIAIELGTSTNLPIHLQLATTTTEITVTEPNQPTTNTITPTEIDSLPISGRRWQTFTLLTPTANPDPDGLLSFQGAAVTQNSTQIDGTSDDQSFGAVPRGTSTPEPEAEENTEFGGANRNAGSRRRTGSTFTFSPEAVQEFRVSGQNYSALYGHAAGGVVTTVAKSGTNTLHGSAFYLFRTSALAATNPFSVATTYTDGTITSATVKPHDLRQQFGGSLGGAAIQDKLFYFYAFDQQNRSFPAISAPSDPAFYSLTPTQTALLGNRGVTTTKINAALNYLDSLTGTVPRRSDHTINFGKLDWQASTRHRLSAQYDRARSTAPGALRTAPVVDRGAASLGSSSAKVDAVLTRWMWQASAHLTNELRFQYGRDLQSEQAQLPLPQEPSVGPGGYAPEVAIGSQDFTFGTPPSLGRKAYPDERRFQFAELATFTHGHHLLQAGADVSFVHDDVSSLTNAEGAFHYDSGTTSGHAGGLVDWITDYTFNVNAYPNGGCPSINATIHDFCFRSFTQSFGPQNVSFSTQEWAAFAEDNWRLRPNLTLSAGLRYDYEFEPLPQHPNAALDLTFGQTGATSVFPEDRNNIAPRVGLSWDPFGAGRGTVRLGYGLFYGRLPGSTIRSALLNTATASSTTQVRITPSTITTCPQVANQGFGYACAYLTTPPAAVSTTTSATVFDRRFRLPMVQQGSVSVEHEVGAGVLGTATYLMNIDRQLPNSVDINIAPSTTMKTFQLIGGTGAPGVRHGETFAVPVYTQRVSADYGPVTDVVSNADGSYNALVIEARRRRARRSLELRASWTWSKAIDDGQASGAAPRTNGQFDPFTLQYDKGLSRLNFPHKIIVSAIWEPHIATDHALLHQTVNGWQIAPLIYRDERPSL